ncbi:MAG: hypothetical protein GKR90_26810 [Pseudomonadales bacterium]|nr:hypothetical protein [Pseudomonadales bacterium]
MALVEPEGLHTLGKPSFAAVVFVALLSITLDFNCYRHTMIIRLKLAKLVRSIRSSKKIESGIDSKPFRLISSGNYDPISERRIEQGLHEILEPMRHKRFARGTIWSVFSPTIDTAKLDVVFLVDEIDKIGIFEDHSNGQNNPSNGEADAIVDRSETRHRKELVDNLLSGLKNLITTSHATFLFIGGRDSIDGYHSESGYKSALYEGLFDQIFYVPTLITDSSDGKGVSLGSMIESYLVTLIAGKEWISNHGGYATIDDLQPKDRDARARCSGCF